MTLVKICGIRTVDEGQNALAAGADWLGFVLYPPSIRNVSADQAEQVVRALRLERHDWKAVGLFVNPSPEFVREMVDQVGFDVVQLAGHEDRDLVEQMPRPVLKTIHVQPGREEQAASLVADNALSAAHYLLDGYRDGWYGGTGEAWNWSALRSIGPRCVTAGGLRPDNVQAALATLAPFGVDVSGGVEFAAGGKDPARVRAFLEAVRRYDHAHTR